MSIQGLQRKKKQKTHKSQQLQIPFPLSLRIVI